MSKNGKILPVYYKLKVMPHSDVADVANIQCSNSLVILPCLTDLPLTFRERVLGCLV